MSRRCVGHTPNVPDLWHANWHRGNTALGSPKTRQLNTPSLTSSIYLFPSFSSLVLQTCSSLITLSLFFLPTLSSQCDHHVWVRVSFALLQKQNKITCGFIKAKVTSRSGYTPIRVIWGSAQPSRSGTEPDGGSVLINALAITVAWGGGWEEPDSPFFPASKPFLSIQFNS